MSETLTIRAATNDWMRVESPSKGNHFVAEVIVAGNDLQLKNGARIKLEVETWAIQGEIHPALLVEAPGYYHPSERTEERDNDIVFYSDE